MKEFLIVNWHWFVVGSVVLVEDGIARSRLRSNSTIQLISSWLRMIPILGKPFGVLAPKVSPPPPQESQPPNVAPPVAVALLFAVALGSGCALSAAGRAHVALATAAQIGEAADKAITAADAAFQSAQVEEATAAGSTVEARAKLAEWRPKRTKARAAMQVYYAGLVGYQVALQTAESAQDKKFDFGPIIAGATKLGVDLVAGLRGLGINVPHTGGQ